MFDLNRSDKKSGKGRLSKVNLSDQNGKSRFLIFSFISIGTISLFVSVGTAIYLYRSFGEVVIEKTIWTAIAICVSIATPLFAGASRLFYNFGNYVLSFIMATFWLIFFGFGTQAHLGFMSVSHAHVASSKIVDSIDFQLSKDWLDRATKDVEAYSKFFNVDVKVVNDKVVAVLQRPLKNKFNKNAGYLGKLTNNCNKTSSYYYDKGCEEYFELLELIKGHSKYLNAVESRRKALEQLAGIQNGVVNNNNGVHELFQAQSSLLGIVPKKVQHYFLFLVAICFELLGSISFVIAGAIDLGGNNSNVIDVINVYEEDADESIRKRRYKRAMESDFLEDV